MNDLSHLILGIGITCFYLGVLNIFRQGDESLRPGVLKQGKSVSRS